jgi:alkylation response protein AidB-like acyl-CoA dehydrogenase
LHILAGAQSEPNVAGSEMFCTAPDPKLGMRTHARRDGDGYILNGVKSGFVTNAGIADHYFIVARTALDRPPAESMSLFYVPADAPGFSVGARTRMLGMVTGQHAELRLEGVRVGADHLIGGEGAALGILSAVLGQGLGAPFVGLARAAYHCALAYAKERRSWGKRVIEHQAIALLLAQMEIDVQSARLLTWDSIAAAMRMDPMASVKSMAAKTHAVDVAIKTAQNAVKILGAYGVTREYQTAKYLCDAMMGYALDFTGDLLRIRIAERL